MVKEYLEKLSSLVLELRLEDEITLPLDVRHFFGGAALYVDNAICASWSPVGLAFRFSEREADELIASGKARPLRYFAKGHIKQEYALFENPGNRYANYWKMFFIKAAKRT